MAHLAHRLDLQSPLAPRHTSLAMAGGAWAQLRATLRLWRRRSRERAQLARFTDLDLHDIGVSRCDAEMELSKPFWRG